MNVMIQYVSGCCNYAVLLEPLINVEEGNITMSDQKNPLEQKNKLLWRDTPPKVTREEMVAAFECAASADKLECDCWNTNCPNFGNCRACVVFHLCLKQLPTCQRDVFDGLQELYIAKTTGN